MGAPLAPGESFLGCGALGMEGESIQANVAVKSDAACGIQIGRQTQTPAAPDGASVGLAGFQGSELEEPP